MSIECTLFRRWGDDCKNNCSDFCNGDCDKLSGACHQCVAGRKDKYENCSRVCEQFEYGIDCLGNCSTICNFHDCYDRVTGRCNVHTTSMYPYVEESSPSFWYIVIIIIFSFMVIAALIAMMSGSQTEPDAAPGGEKVEQYMNEKRFLWDEEAVQSKRKRSGSNVDEPDAFNMDYMQQNVQFNDGKYWALSTLKTFFSPSAAPKAESSSLGRGVGSKVASPALSVTVDAAEAAPNVSEAAEAVAEQALDQATTVLKVEQRTATETENM